MAPVYRAWVPCSPCGRPKRPQKEQKPGPKTDEEPLEHSAVANAAEEEHGTVAETAAEATSHGTFPALPDWLLASCRSCSAGCAVPGWPAEEEILIPAKQEPSPPAVLAQPASHEMGQPDFTGVWHLERSENQSSFMRAIGLNYLVAAAADSVQITYTMEHKNDEFSTVIEVIPPAWAAKMSVTPPVRSTWMKLGDPEVLMMDDAGREFLMLNPRWQGAKTVAGIQYLKLPHKLEMSRYMEEGHMVEHMCYPSKGLEMRRIFRRAA